MFLNIPGFSKPIWALKGWTVLEVRNIEVSYGKVLAVQGLSLDVNEGEIVSLIGANGAGKSSTLRAICGIEKTSAGEVRFMGEVITGLPSHKIVQRGIVQVPEGRMIFGGLTIEENLLLGGHTAPDRNNLRDEMKRLLDAFPVLKDLVHNRGAHLSGGQAQMLALARGLMAGPRLLMLDEPSLGLAPLAVQEVFAMIQGLRERGITILLVEQNVRQALAIADRGYVMEGGKIIIEDAADALLNHDHLLNVFLGLKKEEPI
jgi:branched-chain amino acid transport system ATP-binding protein